MEMACNQAGHKKLFSQWNLQSTCRKTRIPKSFLSGFSLPGFFDRGYIAVYDNLFIAFHNIPKALRVQDHAEDGRTEVSTYFLRMVELGPFWTSEQRMVLDP